MLRFEGRLLHEALPRSFYFLVGRIIGFQCSQSSSEQAAIGIDRKALAPPPRIAGRASGVLTVGFSFTIRAIKSGSSCSPDCFSFGCSRPNFLTKVSSCRTILTAWDGKVLWT